MAAPIPPELHNKTPTSWTERYIRHLLVKTLSLIEDGLYAVFAIILLAVIAVTGWGFLVQSPTADATIGPTLDHVMIVLMLIELWHTVLLFLKTHRFSYEPFLIIGIIAGIRHILIMTAQSTVVASSPNWGFVINLTVTTSMVAIFVLALRIGKTPTHPEEN